MDLTEYEQTVSLGEYLGKNFEKKWHTRYNVAVKKSPINDRHNWDGYWVDKKEYRLSINDALKLQGFHEFNLIGLDKEKWKLLGNTIPNIFTEILGKQIMKYKIFHSHM